MFLILQRNIKRISRRNDKESHYLSCKSIPKDIKEAIERKHSVSNCYKEPPDLLSPNDLQHQDESNLANFLIDYLVKSNFKKK